MASKSTSFNVSDAAYELMAPYDSYDCTGPIRVVLEALPIKLAEHKKSRTLNYAAFTFNSAAKSLERSTLSCAEQGLHSLRVGDFLSAVAQDKTLSRSLDL